jgi:hypothetical protein
MSERRQLPPRLRTVSVAAAVLGTALVFAAAGIAGSASRGAPPVTARSLSQLYFSGTLTRAEVITIVGRVEHDYRVDEGRVTAVRQGSIDLLERDGVRQTIPIGPLTRVVTAGRVFARGTVVRGTRVVVVRDGPGPATQVRPSSAARVIGTGLFGAGLVRAEVLTYQAKTLHDYLIDEGRVIAVKPTSITLLERDGTRQVIPIASTTLVTVNGQPADQTSLLRGWNAIAVRDGNAPAEQVMLTIGAIAGRA